MKVDLVKNQYIILLKIRFIFQYKKDMNEKSRKRVG